VRGLMPDGENWRKKRDARAYRRDGCAGKDEQYRSPNETTSLRSSFRTRTCPLGEGTSAHSKRPLTTD
jgi:hypothetical protein